MLSVGKKAIDFKMKDKDGKEWSLKDFKTKFTVLYFYPKDDTPGCTIEAIDFTKGMAELKKAGVSVVGISGGNDKTKEKFCKKHNLGVLLLSDTDFKVSGQYGVYGEKSFMGRKYMGISRVTFVLDKGKKVIKVFEKVQPLGHAGEVLDFVKSKR